jgi:putative ABC transport system substrate-binding protein
MRLVLRSIVLAVALAGAGAQAQQPQQPARKVARIGVLLPGLSNGSALPALRKALIDLGWVEGRDFALEARFAEGRAERFPQIAAEIVGLDVDVIAVVGAITARAAMKATPRIPIVFAVVVDPIADHLVQSLERPGATVTGVTSFDPQQPRKQLELLKQAIPGLTRVAILGDGSVSEALMKANEEAARALGLVPQRLRVVAPAPDLDGAFLAARRELAGALLVLEEPTVVLARKRIAELAARDRLPTMFAADWADAGGLLAYGTSVLEALRRTASYLDRILKGARPGDLPVESVTRHALIVNLRTARELGVTVPPAVVQQADKVIQ